MRDAVLAEHGTPTFALKPSSIIHAAANDLRIRDKAKKNAAGRRYLFAWEHVRAATSPTDLIQRALLNPSVGAGSPDLNTRMVYRDLDVLRAALALGQEAAS